MLYTNQVLKVVEWKMSFGSVKGVAIGEFGRGRREVFLPTPNGLAGEIRDFRADLSIGLTKSGRPRINQSTDDRLYVILSSQRGYTRRGSGMIKTPVAQDNKIIARGNGADGDAGRIGSWDVIIAEAKDGDVFRVTWGGHGYGYSPTFYVVHDQTIAVADQPMVEDLYKHLIGCTMPFTLTFDEDRMVINQDEWKVI